MLNFIHLHQSIGATRANFCSGLNVSDGAASRHRGLPTQLNLVYARAAGNPNKLRTA